MKEDISTETAVGRPSNDIVYLARNWGWYLLVKELSGLSYAGIDRKYGIKTREKQQGQKSVFSQMLKFARDPTAQKRQVSLQTVYELVHKHRQFDPAKTWYESGLWDVLAQKNESRAYYRDLSEKELIRRGVKTRTENGTEASQRATLDLFSHVIEESSGPDAVRGLSEHLWLEPSALATGTPMENVTLLCIMYREQHLNPSRRYQSQIRKILANELSRLRSERPLSLKFAFDLFSILNLLIEDRIIADTWLSKDDMLAADERVPKLNTNGMKKVLPRRKSQSAAATIRRDSKQSRLSIYIEPLPSTSSKAASKVEAGADVKESSTEGEYDEIRRYVGAHLKGHPVLSRYSTSPGMSRWDYIEKL